jgi:hypothetical protein
MANYQLAGRRSLASFLLIDIAHQPEIAFVCGRQHGFEAQRGASDNLLA